MYDIADNESIVLLPYLTFRSYVGYLINNYIK